MPSIPAATPIHRQAVDPPGRLILGTLAPGAALPSEDRPAGRFAVSHSALRRAPSVLDAPEAIRNRQKTAARVRERRLCQPPGAGAPFHGSVLSAANNGPMSAVPKAIAAACYGFGLPSARALTRRPVGDSRRHRCRRVHPRGAAA